MNIHSYLAGQNLRQRAEIERKEVEILAKITPERRYFPGKIEFRASKEGGPGEIEGYAAVFNTLSVDLGGFYEKLAPGCFDDVMKDDCRCLYNHRAEAILGRSSAGTLELVSDQFGLRFRCMLPETSAGRDAAVSIERRDITGCSFAFTMSGDPEDVDWDWDVPMRTIKRVNGLFDVGPVTYPAYESTSVDMRSFQAARDAAAAARLEAVKVQWSRSKARLALAVALLR